MKLTKKQRLELGITIFAAVESCKNDFSLKVGTFVILKETELSKMPKSIQDEFSKFSPQLQRMFTNYCHSMKEKLDLEAFYVSGEVLKKLNDFRIINKSIDHD